MSDAVSDFSNLDQAVMSSPSPAATQATFAVGDERTASRIVPRRARHAAAGMGAGAAMVETLERAAIARMAKHRPRREQLIQ